ncbi:hypothetical protein ACOMHN_030338 [Nucella lapillus]
MDLLRQGLKLLLLTPVVLLCSIMILLQLLVAVVRHGPRAVFSSKRRVQPPAVLQNPQLGTHGYIYLEDLRIHYVSAGSEDKPLMLLVHGFPEFWYSWRHQLIEFQKDYRVVALDQRGYGDSDKPSSVSSYSIKKLADDIKQLVAALGYERCVLVGHDWGGKVAWSVAQRYPQVVSRLVILNCPSSLAYMKMARTGFHQIRRSWYFFFFQALWLPELFMRANDYEFFQRCFLQPPHGIRSGQMTEKDVEAYKFAFGRGGFTAPLNYYRQMVRSSSFMNPSSSDLARVTMPTLIVWGDQDQALDPQLADLSSQHSVQGGATVRMIEGASHWVQMDRPDLVNQYMRQFLAASSKEGGAKVED